MKIHKILKDRAVTMNLNYNLALNIYNKYIICNTNNQVMLGLSLILTPQVICPMSYSPQSTSQVTPALPSTSNLST